MRSELAQKVDDGLLAEELRLSRQSGGGLPSESLDTTLATAGPAPIVCDSHVCGCDPGGLVPEDRVDAALEHPVRPVLAEVAIGRAGEAGCSHAATVVEHLALLWMECDPAALGLAAERSPEPPRARLHREALSVRERHDRGHRVVVVREVVLGEGVENAGVTPGSEIGHVLLHVAQDPD